MFVRPGPTIAEASAFFLSLKQADVGAPDESGSMEGRFAVPVEEVVPVLQNMIWNEFRTMLAYKIYAQSLRDLSHHSIAEELETHAEHESEHADFLLRRLSVLSGPIEIPSVETPPPSSDPVEIIQNLIRIEQEGAALWRQLHGLMGDNSMKFKVEEYMGREQEHIDELWQLLPHQPDQVQEEDPAQSQVLKSASQAFYGTGEFSPMGWAMMGGSFNQPTGGMFNYQPSFQDGGGMGMPRVNRSKGDYLPNAYLKEAGLSVLKLIKTAAADKSRSVVGKERAEANVSAKFETLKHTRGQVHGETLGKLLGAGAGYVAAKKGGGSGTEKILAAALGQHLGGKGGKGLGQELDKMRHEKKANTLGEDLGWVENNRQGLIEEMNAHNQFLQNKNVEAQQAQEQLQAQIQQVQQQAQAAAQESAMKDQQIQQITQTMQMASNASTKALGDMVSANQEAIRQRQMSAQVKSEMDGLKQHLMELGGQAPPSPPADMAGAPEVGPGMQAQVDQSSPQAQQAQQQAAQAQQAQQAPQQPAQAEGGQPKQGSFKQMVRSMYTRRI